MFFFFIAVYGTPILAIIFCVNLVTIIKKVKEDQSTAFNTFLLTTSFILMAWSIAFSALAN